MEKVKRLNAVKAKREAALADCKEMFEGGELDADEYEAVLAEVEAEFQAEKAEIMKSPSKPDYIMSLFVCKAQWTYSY
jgi:hypothetical protein